MITNKDVEKLKEVFVTKEEHEANMINTAKSFADVQEQLNDIKYDLSGLKKDVSGLKVDVAGLKKDVSGLKVELADLKNEVTNGFDLVLGEIKKLHDENIITSSYKRTLVDHEERIVKIERVQAGN